jgi:hypothetical protein
MARRTVLKGLKEVGQENVDWIHMARDRDHSGLFKNTAMKLWVSYKGSNFSSN